MRKINILFTLLCLPFFALAQTGSVSPSSGSSGQTLDVTISGKGTHFTQATGTVTQVFFNGGSISNTTVLNDTVIKTTIKISKSATTGVYQFSVVNNIEKDLILIFNVDGTDASRLQEVLPASGNAGQTLDVTITGTNTSFTKAQNYVKFAFIMGTSTVTVVDDTMLKAHVIIPSNAATGDFDVNVSNSIDGYMNLSRAFHVNGVAQPYLVSISPATGRRGETLDVTITGANTNFATNNNTKVSFGFTGASSTLDVNSVTVLSPTSLKANITIKKNTSASYQDVNVSNSIDGALALGKAFYVSDAVPCNAYFVTEYDSINNRFLLNLDSATTFASTYLWDFGDGNTSTSQAPSHSFAHDTLYNVCLRITTSAGDTCKYCHIIGIDSLGNPVRKTQGFNMSVIPAKIHVGVPEVSNELSVVAYPNPASEVLTISTIGLKNSAENNILSVYSIEGRLLLQQTLIKDQTDIDVSDFAKGIYLMQVRNEEQSKIIKFVKD